MKQVKLINPNKEELTSDKLKELIKNCNYTDEQLIDFVFSIKTLVHIIVQYQMQQEKLFEESEHLKIAP